MDPEYGNRQLNSHDLLAQEVYGVAAEAKETDSGELVYTDKATGQVITNKSAVYGLKIRSWIQKIGAEEGGIERVPEDVRTNQHPR